MNERLALLNAVDAVLPETEVLRLALQQAVAELGGLGGVVHLRGSANTRRMYLVAVSGLPRAFTRSWDGAPDGAPKAPAEALREGTTVWLPAPAGPGTGMVSTPLLSRKGPFGALSVVTTTPGGPAAAQQETLRAVAAWAAERLRRAGDPVVTPPDRQAVPGAPDVPGSDAPGPPESPEAEDALRATRIGSWELNARSGRLRVDDSLLETFGFDPDTYDGRTETWMSIIHPDDRPWVAGEWDQAVGTFGLIDLEYRVRRPDDGTLMWAHVRGRAEPDGDGRPSRVVGTAWDSTESGIGRDAIRRALRFMSDGFLSLDDTWRITFVNVRAERLLDSSRRRLIGAVLWDVPVVRRVPGLESRCRETAAGATAAGFDVEWPDTGRWFHIRLVPSPDGLACYFADITEARQREADRVAAERQAAERAARIQELTADLAEAVTTQDVTHAVARRVLRPFGASGLIIQVNEDDRMWVVGSVGYPQAFLNKVSGASMSVRSPGADRLRTRAPWFCATPEEYVRTYPEHADRPGAISKQAWAFLPLIVSGRAIGVCVIAFDEPHHFTGEEQTLLMAVSGLVSHALERARLYDAEHSRAQQLQRTLLPQTLPELPAVTAAARYLPAGQSMDVGGDWYDVIPVSGCRVALVIGDVMGHGLPEAVTMGRLRTAVRTLTDLELPPDEILIHLNDLISGLGDDSFATCLYAVYDPTSGVCTFARAGHPPPAVVRPDGTVSFPDSAPDPPLGAAEPPFETVELTVPEDGLLVFYTDGLVESACRDIDAGMGRLAELLGEHPDGDLDELCDTLTADLLPADQQNADDTALLVVRAHRLAADAVATWNLPDDPQSAGTARKHVGEQLAAWHLEDLVTTTELLVSELIANVVRHARGPVRLRLLHSTTLVCEVYDGSPTTPRIRRAAETDESGRGLQMVAALSEHWGTRYTATGKCIWTEQPLVLPDTAAPLMIVPGLDEVA
ncbi:SpoIIE family protein phosphatase [Streptomyces lushanensis]|uniref:SpoIIE family protein phosphatase n=1 Tax=Streptomyces lushanensis TaxID=1434255 RepID=UPI00082C6E2C|nr:SpoIIE family protein phosphatase [Streptomyces lushanensis]